MADQQRKVSLIFEANASQAKNEINSLISSLQKVQATPKNLINFSSVEKASKAAVELQTNLQRAVNTDTGKLDLSRFATSLKTSGKDLEHYRDVLVKLGPSGNTAFKALSSNINKAEVSTLRLTKGMQDFLTTLKNTAKWQLSSSIMHGLMGAIQTAYGYAQSLDASLNNIRIVTGHSSEQMAKFAVEANRAAQALSTTTTKYTDAALIFYQQGLNDQAVKERTEAVIKMANVTGEVAADVSSYMTAIWNNFDDGSKSIEYYADVITKLGAATAASSEEIAGGLEKFAAIGNTIGLSYEYATSMITTIVDKTRQSEDVVGTALKTILARIQGLNLGDTLEDGTTLNKYSNALAKVGINIKDTSGELKSMDSILDELGEKWGTLSQDTQVALAQVVGGVRQYNQIISLMNNWDSFQNNVRLAETSAGSLNEQSEIFAEGWEAARNRVRTAAEGIYDALINEQAFIKLDNVFTGLLNSVSGLIKGMGGMVPIMGTIFGVITTKMGKEVPVAMQRMRENLNIFTGKAQNDALDLQHKNTIINEDNVSRADNSYEMAQYETLRRISKMKEFLIKNQKDMNSAQIEEYNLMIQSEQAIRDIVEERAKSLAVLEDEIKAMQDLIALQNAMDAPVDDDLTRQFTKEAEEDKKRERQEEPYINLEKRKEELEKKVSKTGYLSEVENQEYASLEASLEAFEDTQSRVFDKRIKYINNLTSQMVDYSAQQGIATKNAEAFKTLLKDNGIKQYGNNLQDLKTKLENWDTASFQSTHSTKMLKEAIDLLGQEGGDSANKLEKVEKIIRAIITAEASAAKQAQITSNGFRKMAESAGASKENLVTLQSKAYQKGPQEEGVYSSEEPRKPKIDPPKASQILTESLGALMTTYGALNAVVEAHRVLTDEDATAMEKTGAIVGFLTSTMYAFLSVNQAVELIRKANINNRLKETMASWANSGANMVEGASYGFLAKMANKAKVAIGGLLKSHPVGWILGIVAALTVAGVAIYKWVNRLSDTEKKIKSLKEESQALGKAQEHLTKQIEEVKSAWDNYQEMTNALKECTVGTEEWNQALNNVNQSILDIIQKSPELASKIQYDENGQAYLKQEDYQSYLAQEQRTANLISSQKTIVDANLSDVQNQEYLFGSQQQYESLNKFWTQKGDFESWGSKELAKNLKDLKNIFSDDGDFINYVEKAGIIDNLTTAKFSNNSINSGRILTNLLELGFGIYKTYDSEYKNSNSINTLQSEWLNALNTQSSNQIQRDLAYQNIFTGTEGYELLNQKLYEPYIESEIKKAKEEISSWQDQDILNAYERLSGYEELTLDGDDILNAGEKIEGLTMEAVKASVALGEVASKADLLATIVDQGNQRLEGLTDFAKNIVREGTPTSGSISAKRNAIRHSPSKNTELPIYSKEDVEYDEDTYITTANWIDNKRRLNAIPGFGDLVNNTYKSEDYLTFLDTTYGTRNGSSDPDKFLAYLESDDTILQNYLNDINNGTIEILKGYGEYFTNFAEENANLPQEEIYTEFIKYIQSGDITKDSILDTFYDLENASNLKKSPQRALEKWLEDFGNLYFSEEELKNLEIDWFEIARRIEKGFLQNYENATDQWKLGSNRLSKALSYDKARNEFNINENEAGGKIASALDATNSLSAKNIQTFMEGFELISGGLTNSALNSFESELSNLIITTGKGEGVIQAFNKLFNQALADGNKLTATDVINTLEEVGVETENLDIDFTTLINTLNIASDSLEQFTGSVDGFITKLGAGQKVFDSLETGKEISLEDYESIKEDLSPEEQALFARSLNGYTYYGDEEQALDMASRYYDNTWADYRAQAVELQKTGDIAFENSGLGADLTSTSLIDWMSNASAKELAKTKYFADASGLGAGNYEALQSAIQSGAISVENGKISGDENVVEIAKTLAENMASYFAGTYGEGSIEAQQVAMTSAGSTEELLRRKEKGDIKIGEEGISEEQFDVAYNQLQLDEFELEYDIPKEEIDELGNSIQKMAENMSEAELEARGFSKELAKNASAADEVAKDIKRYDRALEDVSENYDDWMEALESDNISEQTAALQEMDRAYSDMLDLDYGTLSDSFLTNADNLELMKEAANGSSEAYEKLQLAAQQDILAQCVFDTENFNTAAAEVQAKMDEMNFQDIEVGAKLETEGFLDSLTEMVNAANMTAQQATDYLSSMGIDATVVEDTTEQDEVSAYSITPTTSLETVHYNAPVAGPWSMMTAMDATFPKVEYNADPVETTKVSKATALKVTSARKSSGGSFKHANSSGGSRSSRRGGGGGGRRGGGGGETRAVRGTAKPTSEKDRYHTIKNQLEDITDNYDKISKASDRAFGKAKIKLLQEQQKELKKLAAAQQEYIKEIEQNLASDKKNLDQVSAYVGFDVEFDENGTITNFDKIQDALYDIYNSKIDENGEVVGLDEEAWEKFQEEWEKILALIEQYEETQDLRKEALQELQDYINDIYDLQLEEITYSVEIDIEAAEFSLELLDHLIGLIEDDAWDAADAIALMGEKASNLLEQNDTYVSGIQRVMGMHSQPITDSAGNILQQAGLTAGAAEGYINGSQGAINDVAQAGLNGAFTQEAIDTLTDYHSSLLDISEALIELREEVYATVLRAFEQFNEEMDRSISKIEHLRNMTKYYRDIVDIVGKENLDISNALLEASSQVSVNQSIDQLEGVKAKREMITKEIADAEEALQIAKNAGLEEDVKLWEKNLTTMYESLQETEEEFMDSWIEALEAVNEQFELTIKNISEMFNDTLAGPMRKSLDQLQDAFDRQNSLNAIHLEDYEKIYHLSALTRDISKSIDETDNIKGKQKLAELQEEINALEESGAEVSAYQTEDLRRRYELRLAELALQEAQNTKSQVQMSRDSDGNWNYVYTADEDAVAEAEQNYEDRLFAIQQANAEYINTMENNLIQAQAELQAKIEEIALDQTLSMEEKQAMIDEYTAYYTEKFNEYASELELVLDNNKTLYEEDWQRYSELTGYRISADEQYIDSFNETTYSIVSGFTTLEQVQSNFKVATENMLANINTAFTQWATNIDTTMKAAGTSTQEFKTKFETEMNAADTKSNQLKDDIIALGTKASDTFGDIVDAAVDFALKYSEQIDATVKKNAELADSYAKLLQAWSDYQTAVNGPEDPPPEDPPPETDPGDPPPETPPTEDKTEKGKGTLTINSGYKYYIYKTPDETEEVRSIGTLHSGTYEFTKMDNSTKFKRVYIPEAGGWVSTTDPDEKDNGASRLKVTMYDTGGYTGSWGREGRMAMLHEKELVLNKEDTSNILSAVDMIRKISEVIDLNAIASAGFNSKYAWSNKFTNEGQTFEQHVSINAEFPNATDRNEIYEAFNELINTAVQYSNRR